MPSRHWYAAGLLALAGSSLALRTPKPTAGVDNDDWPVPDQANELARKWKESSCVPPAAFRQQLMNMMDLQYYTEIKVGNQTIMGIIDTGSFELVVFSRNCMSCGRAGLFDEKRSQTFRAGTQSKVHAYGSGSCKSKDGRDEVKLGCYKAPSQALWLAWDCRMDLLQEASFNAIVGVGPPGQPEFTARDNLRQVEELEDHYRKSNAPIPAEVAQVKRLVSIELEDAQKMKTMLETFGMRTFSTCLGRAQGSPAWMVWNDITREGTPGVMKVPVVGNITWGIKLDGIGLDLHAPASASAPGPGTFSIGCEKGCGAVVDTGTSLIGVPTATYNKAVEVIEKHVMAQDCSDLSVFPFLTLQVGGHTLRLPPSSYIGIMHGQMNEKTSQFMRSRQQSGSIMAKCQLLLMDLGTELTQFGPMVILGMPLFREYYTTFDLGRGRGTRSILLSSADDSCYPDLGKSPMNFFRDRDSATAFKPRHVDASKIRIPTWLPSRTTTAM